MIAASKQARFTLAEILIPVDFSEASLEGLEYAIQLGESFGAELIVLFVVEPLYQAADMGLLLEEHQRLGREDLRQLGLRLTDRSVKFRAVLRTGRPHQVIIDEARKQHVDMIVMATHGRSGISHLIMGSVAEKVVSAAGCPVLTVRPNKPARTLRPAAAAHSAPVPVH